MPLCGTGIPGRQTASPRGKTVMVTSHYMDEVERCDQICFIFRGELIARGTPSSLKEDYIGGETYSIETNQRFKAMEILTKEPWARNPFPSGKMVRFLADGSAIKEGEIGRKLMEMGLEHETLKKVKPTLEDVFVSLVAER